MLIKFAVVADGTAVAATQFVPSNLCQLPTALHSPLPLERKSLSVCELTVKN
jgi:hypothetical protein